MQIIFIFCQNLILWLAFIGNYNILSPKELDSLGLKYDFKKDIALRPETIEISNEGLETKIKKNITR